MRPMNWDGKAPLEGEEDEWTGASRDLEPRVVQVPLSQLDSLSSVRIYTPKELVSIEGRMRVQRAMNEVVKRFPDGVPMLDPESDMKIDQDNFRKLKRRIEGLEAMMARHLCTARRTSRTWSSSSRGAASWACVIRSRSEP